MKRNKKQNIDWSKVSAEEKLKELTRLRRLYWGDEVIDKGMDKSIGFIRRMSDGAIVRILGR